MTKAFLISTAILTCSLYCKAQNDFVIDFDSLNGQWPIQLYTDSVLDPRGLWQIGIPRKTSFSTAHSHQFAIMTDTVNSFPVNTSASFIVKAKTTQFIFTILTFYNRFDSDSSNDGGYVEYSVDSGQTWEQISIYSFGGINNEYGFWLPEWRLGYWPPDTLASGERFFTGTSPEWYQEGIEFPCWAVKTGFSSDLWFKFTFTSDSVPDNKDGWIIDDIEYIDGTWICSGVEEKNPYQNAFSISPNPGYYKFRILFPEPMHEKFSVMIYDIMGRKLIQEENNDGNLPINCSLLSPGAYFVQLINRSGTPIGTQKLLIDD